MPIIGLFNSPHSSTKSFSSASAVNPDFISTWDTTQAGSASDTVVLPLLSGGTYSGTIDWGDGSKSVLSYANRTHVYAVGGTYTITISGSDIQGWSFNNGGDKAKITDVSNWGNFTLDSLSTRAFYNCPNLVVSATDSPSISPLATNIWRIFATCPLLTGINLSGMDVSNVTDAYNVFESSTALVSANISGWNTSQFTNINSMFLNADSITDDLSGWDVSNVQTMFSTFNGCSATTMMSTIGSWTTSALVSANETFRGSSMNTNINGWDMSSVTNIDRMFMSNTSFNQSCNGWNTSSVQNMYRVFYGATAYDQSMSNWDVSAVTNLSQFMSAGAGLSTANYNATLIGWEASLQAAYPGGVGYPHTINVDFGTSIYTCGGAADAARQSLVINFGWTISDGGSTLCPFISTWDTTQAGSASDTVVLPLLSGGTYNGTIDWGDGNTSSLSYANRTHVYASSGTYTITITGTDIQGFQFNNGGDKAKIIDISNWGDLTITTPNAFYGCVNLVGSATDYPNITATDLKFTFAGCTVFNAPVENWPTGSVTNFWAFLQGTRAFNQPLNGLDVSSGTNFVSFLQNTNAFDQPLGDLDIANATNMSNFFYGFGGITQLSTANYDATLIGWEATLQAAYPSGAGYTATININMGVSTYTLGGAGEVARTSLISTFGWTISDGGGV